MKHSFFLIFIYITILCSCSNETLNVPFQPQTPTNECESKHTATIDIRNKSKDIYNIYINDVFKKQIEAESTDSFIISSGLIKLKAIQVSGDSAQPKIKLDKIAVQDCQQWTWDIP